MRHFLLVFISFFIALGFQPRNLFAQQGVLFTQYLFNGLILNPAYAGYQDEITINSTYRSQWLGIPGAPKSLTLSLDGPILQDKLAFGALVVKDQLGAQNNLQMEFDIAYRVQLGQNSNLNFGIGGNLNQNSLNPSLLVLLVPETVTSKYLQNSVFPNLRFGLFWYNAKNYIGLSANDLRNIQVNPGNLYIGIHPNYYFTAGHVSSLLENMRLKSSFLFQEDFINPTNLDLNFFLLFPQNFWLGFSYRTDINLIPNKNLTANLVSRNSLSGAVEIFAPGSWRFGYSYDYSLNQLANVSQGSHEISVGYHFHKKSIKDPTRKCYYF